ncbi:MAG: beta-ketoacyl-ACP synthase 3, partial [Rickettsiales bacterium]|nr:beta-ketoacyl-ACP synthase 3 [Rickettsiales bacterium]
MIRSIIQGTGMYLPEKVLTNTDLVSMVDTSDSWIKERTGISQRHIAADNEVTSDMASQAGRDALTQSGLAATDIDMVIVATTTPDNTFPATATKVQAQLGIKQGFAFDIQAVCSGFVYALSTADNFIKSGQVQHALVIGADKMSAIIDWSDRKTCVLFGDGAGAVVLSKNESNDGRGIQSSHLYSDGDYFNILHTD